MIIDNSSKGEGGELRLDCVKLDGKTFWFRRYTRKDEIREAEV